MLIIFREPSRKVQPAKSPLHDPSLWQDLEAFNIVIAFDNFQSPTAEVFYPADKLAPIASISPDQPKAWEALKQTNKDRFGSSSILYTRSMHDQHENQPQSIHGNMTFAPLDFLARIISALPPF